MALSLSASMAIAAADALVDTIDIGPATSHLVIYDGTVPTDVTASIGTSVALVSFDLPDPAFGNAADSTFAAVATANTIAQVQAAADGTATYFRIFDGNGAAILQGGVSNIGGGAELQLSSTSIIQDIDVIVVSLVVRMPKSNPPQTA